MGKVITEGHLRELLGAEMKAGSRVVGPVKLEKGYYYQKVSDPSQLDFQGGKKPPERSLKEFIFPATEDMMTYAVRQDGVTMQGPSVPRKTLLVGGRPCDARAFLALDKLFSWDFDDELYQASRKATTVVTLACPGGDEDCFCQALGSSPEDRAGSDLFLTPRKDGYFVEALTQTGEALVQAHSKLFSEVPDSEKPVQKAAAASGKPDFSKLQHWMASNFENEVWDDLGRRCLGCGVCAHVCPTCHCFDMVDEPEDATRGVRRRNWDSCQIPLFTLHASGHNPRSVQPKRYRQRLLHKFQYFPERFGTILCTGCGRCSRACPVDQDILAALENLSELAEQAK